MTPTSSSAVEGRAAGAWSRAWRSARFRVECAGTAVALGAVMSVLSVVLAHVERRPGVLLADPVLDAFAARDFTWLTFGAIYLALGLAVVHLARAPHAFVRGVQAYAVLMAMRSVTILLVPLAAPAGMILLVDPIARHLVAGPALTKDLFFSGHVSTLFLLYLLARSKPFARVFLGCAGLVAVTVLWQHVHYTIDVVAAPPFAYASVSLVRRARR